MRQRNTEGCGNYSPNGYLCTHHNQNEHLCRGIEEDSLADSWPLSDTTQYDEESEGE